MLRLHLVFKCYPLRTIWETPPLAARNKHKPPLFLSVCVCACVLFSPPALPWVSVCAARFWLVTERRRWSSSAPRASSHRTHSTHAIYLYICRSFFWIFRWWVPRVIPSHREHSLPESTVPRFPGSPVPDDSAPIIIGRKAAAAEKKREENNKYHTKVHRRNVHK